MEIISEIGQNFLGDKSLAHKMIKDSFLNGASACKFQLFDTDKIYTPGTELYHLAKKAELSLSSARELFLYGEKTGIEVFFSVFDVERVGWCEEIGVKRYKIAKRSNQDIELINTCIKTGKPVIMSSHKYILSMDLAEYPVHQLYCVGNYPTVPDQLQFSGVDFYEFQGYSDHTEGIEACMVAIARGANIIEKHFCLGYDIGVDAQWSMTPADLSALVTFYHQVREML